MDQFIFTVSELNLASQKILESHFPNILVEGEISNLSRPTSGHLYFSLKDAKAQIRCAMFRMQARSINFELRNGLLVQLKAKVSLYPDRGDYQLIVESMALSGDGLLRQAYEKLVQKLTQEGLFQEQYKKPLPLLPMHIGVITSPTGAAVRDILSTLKRRFPAIRVTIFPTKVQGNEASPEIVKAIQLANQVKDIEVIIVARGGGSLEDLWPFNEEAVARAIFASAIPIVSGVGHETDFTISDFVADKRAATPTAAAELVTPNQEEWFQYFLRFEQKFKNEILKCLGYRAQQLDHLLKRLRHPGQHIETQIQRLNSLLIRLRQSISRIFKDKYAFQEQLLRTLHAVSPLATLGRGYAIVTHESSGKVLSSVKDIKASDTLKIKLSDGELCTQVV